MFATLVSDLLAMQGEVQQHAPSLSNAWGYLAAQGKALLAGTYSSLTQDQWVSRYRDFMQQLTGMDTSTTFMQAVQQGGTTEAVQTVADSVASLPANIATGAVNLATTAGQAVGGAVAGAATPIIPLLPSIPWLWIGLGIGAIVLVPMLWGNKK